MRSRNRSPTIRFIWRPDTPDCLFDCDGKHRYVTLTGLLAVDSQQDMDALLARLEGCTGIGVILDYKPASWGNVVRAFFRHRMLQALRLLEDRMPYASVRLMEPPDLGLAA